MHRYTVFAAVAILVLLCGAASGTSIAFFDNAAYTDPTRESPNLAASLAALGHTTFSFSGITAADFAAATAGRDLLVIPELDNGDLFAALSPAARTQINSYVTGGGGLIVFDRTTSAPRTIDLLNGIFGFSLAPGGISGDQSLDAAAAAGTPFAGGPATLPDSDATEGVTTASLPLGALSIYFQGANTSVFLATAGSGRIVFLGFDWFALPTPAAWETVLGSAVTATASAPIPEPSSIGMLGAGLAGLAGWMLRRRSSHN